MTDTGHGALYQPIEKEDGWFVATIKILKFKVYKDHTLTERKDIITGGPTFRFYLRRDENDEESLYETPCSVEDDGEGGVVVAIFTVDNIPVEFAGRNAYAVKRTDSESVDIIAYGPAEIQLSAAR